MANAARLAGEFIGKRTAAHPTASRRMLALCFGAYDLQLMTSPPKGMVPYQTQAALQATKFIHRCLSHTRRTAVVSIFTPCEYFMALDKPLLFAEGLAGFLNGIWMDQTLLGIAHEQAVTRTLCSYHQILLGAAESHLLDTPGYIINTTTCCDANASTFRELSRIWNIPRLQIDVPQEETPGSVEYVAGQLRNMKAFIEEQEGRKIDPQKLSRVVETENRNTAMLHECMELISHKQLTRTMLTDMYQIFYPLVMAGSEGSEIAYRSMLEALRQAPESDPKTVRIMWAHSIPFWQLSLKQLLEKDPQVQFLISDMNLIYQDYPLDMNHLEESMARRLIHNYYAGPLKDRTDAVARWAKIMKADGVVWFAHWGCHHTQGAGPLARKQLEKQGLPCLVLDGDGADRSNINDGQMKTKLQAFLEMLKEAKG